ncbi:MAG: hypothetical protein ACTSP3_17215, partial [Candidatus Heimdallarchaeaceae archaeon]
SRMEHEGKAISLAADDQMKMLREIESFMKKPIQRLYLNYKTEKNSPRKNKQSTAYFDNRKKTNIVLHATD